MNRKELIERTRQKLRYAKLHLEELVAMPANLGRGSDFERAHQEAFLSQLFGAYDSFLIELNLYLGCGLPEEHISLGKLHKAVNAKGESSPILTELFKLDRAKDGWFRTAKDMRDLSTHVKGIPLAYQYGGGVKVALKHPRTMKEHDMDVFVAFYTWLAEMEQLIKRGRRTAG